MLVKPHLKKTQSIIHGGNVLNIASVNANSNTGNVDNEYVFRPHPVHTETVILTIKSLNDTKSVGCDGIPMRFIKDSLYVIAFYLTCIINTSIVTGTFPSFWKHDVVVPLFKGSDVNDVCNLRPISLLPIVSKILEKIVTNQLVHFLENNRLLSNSQYGFRPKLSTQTALPVITDEIFKNMDSKKISLLTLCDLSKAFDGVRNKMILHKCSELNIDNFWFKNYLENRSQSVRLNKALSDKLNIAYSDPRGSILGPVLFSM